MVEKVLDLSVRTVTDEEKMLIAGTWAEEFVELIPEHRLEDAFRIAIKHHDSSFPLNAFEIITSWKQLNHDELEEAARRKSLFRDTDRIGNCANIDRHITDDGMVLWSKGLEYVDIEVPCGLCRKEEHFEARNAYVRMN